MCSSSPSTPAPTPPPNNHQVLNDCEKKHSSGDSKYSSLADAISERLRDAVSEEHWENARRIQKELEARTQKKKTSRRESTSKSTRMDLFLLVRILFEYLERVDRAALDLAKKVSCT